MNFFAAFMPGEIHHEKYIFSYKFQTVNRNKKKQFLRDDKHV